MSAAKKSASGLKEPKSFEEALERLEEIVEELEGGRRVVCSPRPHRRFQSAQLSTLPIVAHEPDASTAALAELTHDLEPARSEARSGDGCRKGRNAVFHWLLGPEHRLDSWARAHPRVRAGSGSIARPRSFARIPVRTL